MKEEGTSGSAGSGDGAVEHDDGCRWIVDGCWRVRRSGRDGGNGREGSVEGRGTLSSAARLRDLVPSHNQNIIQEVASFLIELKHRYPTTEPPHLPSSNPPQYPFSSTQPSTPPPTRAPSHRKDLSVLGVLNFGQVSVATVNRSPSFSSIRAQKEKQERRWKSIHRKANLSRPF